MSPNDAEQVELRYRELRADIYRELRADVARLTLERDKALGSRDLARTAAVNAIARSNAITSERDEANRRFSEMTTPTGREIELTIERDEAREAARWLLPFTMRDARHTATACSRWTWLESHD